MKTISVSEELQKRVKILSANNDKKIYEIVEEAIDDLENKYSRDDDES
jgi:predicted transcriptional regulator